MFDSCLCRRVAIDDAAALSGLLTQLGYPDTEEFMANKLSEVINDAAATCWVAEINKTVVGFLSLHLIPQIALAGDFARISYFCIDDTARNNGVGKSLLRQAELYAREQHCDRIEVHCHHRRVDAHRFYVREGFAESPKYFIKML
jgi:GNAT superfamily N-acetyltransferase